MSTEDGLTEREEALLNLDGEDQEQTTDRSRTDARRRAITGGKRSVHEQVDELRELVVDTRHQLAIERKERLNLETKLDNIHTATTQDGAQYDTIIQSYVAMTPDEREDLVGPSDRRAAVLAEHWWDLARQNQKGNYVISTHRNSTKKHNPSQIKIDLEKYCGEDLHWYQVYRAFRTLAKKSAGSTDDVEVFTDDAGRKHIVGGAFQYHERATPDGSDTYKLVELVDDDLSITVDSEIP